MVILINYIIMIILKLFRCYTDCGGEAFDIYELTRKVKSRENPKERWTKEGNII